MRSKVARASLATMAAPLPKQRSLERPRTSPGLRWLAAVAMVVVTAAMVLERPVRSAVGCDIKGNVARSGERIFHVPGQAYYDETRIDPLRGERWFCSEEAATAAGWRRARL